MSKRKICVVTGTRAEYGLLHGLMKSINNHNEFELQTLVTGMHLSPEFGLTYKNIKEDEHKVYIDGIFKPNINGKLLAIKHGDRIVPIISAASILAKVYRDKIMIKMSKKFKNYSWNKNFGYGTKQHLLGLKKYGLTSMHRKNFKPIHKMLLK